MSVFRVVGLVAVIASLAACADDTDTDESASKSTSHLSDDGIGDDVPAPPMPMPPGPWDDENWKPPAPVDRDHDPLGWERPCGYGYQKIYDPTRSDFIEVRVVSCN